MLHRLRLRQQNGGRTPISSVIREASADIRRPLVYATLVVLLAIVPAAVLGGRPGAFLAPLVLGYVLAVAASMIVALTVTPALTLLLFTRWEPSSTGSKLRERVATGYLTLLQRFTRGLRPSLLTAGICAAVGIAVVPVLGVSLIPTFADRNVLVRLESQAGTSSPRMTEITTQVARQLQAVPGVGNVGAHVGRAVTGDRVTNVSSSDVWVSINPDADHDETLAAIIAAVDKLPEVRGQVTTYSEQKLRDVGALVSGENSVRGSDLNLVTGADKPLVVRLFGQDSDVLAREASRVRDIISTVDGVVDPQVDVPTVTPTIEIEVNLDRAQAWGLNPGDVRRTEATLLQGIQVGSIFQLQKVFDVVVQGTPSVRGSIDEVRKLLIDRPGGGHVTLGEVADVRVAESPSVIRRDAVSRRLDVQADISGRDVAAVVSDIENRLAEMDFALEYHAEVLDEQPGRDRVRAASAAMR